jgi:hypothetical protein
MDCWQLANFAGTPTCGCGREIRGVGEVAIEDDERLRRAVEAALPLVRDEIVQLEANEKDGEWVNWPRRWRSQLAEVNRLVLEHPDVHSAPQLFFGGRTLYTYHNHQEFAVPLMRVACERGAAEAVAWLKRVCATKSADMRFIMDVHGISVQAPMTFANGVTLMRMRDLTSSENVRSVIASHGFSARGLHFAVPPVAAVLELPNHPGQTADELIPRFADIAMMQLSDVVRGLTLAGDLKPMASKSWSDFVDRDFALASSGNAHYSSIQEGSSDHLGQVNITPEHVALANRYLGLNFGSRLRLATALNRLNQAKRRRLPGDKAIDGSICLEAVFRPPERGKQRTLARRSSVLLESDASARDRVAERVRAFYNLRSRTVHGDLTGAERDGEAIAVEGLDICIRVCLRISDLGGILDMAALDQGSTP